MSDVTATKRRAVIRANLIHAAQDLPPDDRSAISDALGPDPPVHAPGLSDAEFVHLLLRLEAHGKQHDSPPRYWRSLQEAASHLGKTEIRDRMERDFMDAVRRRVGPKGGQSGVSE